MKVTNSYVSKVLRNNLGMTYKKIKPVPFNGNSERCLVLRQLYAKKMLHLLSKDWITLSIDETWCPTMDYSCRKWKAHGDTNSVPSKKMRDRVCLLVAIDTEGDCFLSIT